MTFGLLCLAGISFACDQTTCEQNGITTESCAKKMIDGLEIPTVAGSGRVGIVADSSDSPEVMLQYGADDGSTLTAVITAYRDAGSVDDDEHEYRSDDIKTVSGLRVALGETGADAIVGGVHYRIEPIGPDASQSDLEAIRSRFIVALAAIQR